MRRARNLLLAATLACACLPAAAHATPTLTLHATLTPERLGRSTTLGLDLRIAGPPGQVIPPLSKADVLYPANLGITTGGLGIATCTQTTLEARGPEGCPADSRLGSGNAIATILASPEIQEEPTTISIFMAPMQHDNLAVLLYASGQMPLSAQIVLGGLLLPTPAPFGGELAITAPPIPSWPEGPDISVVSLRATIGPPKLTYYEHTHGKIIPYHPQGVLLPTHCPRGGFPFAATLNFQDGDHTSAHTTIPCPKHKTTTNHTQPHDRRGPHQTPPSNPSNIARGAPPRAASRARGATIQNTTVALSPRDRTDPGSGRVPLSPRGRTGPPERYPW